MEISNLFVVLMGIGTVFFGLICIIILVTITGKIVTKLQKPEAPKTVAAAPAPVAAAPVQNKSEIIAAVAAAIAEELGTDVSGIRIHSFKKI